MNKGGGSTPPFIIMFWVKRLRQLAALFISTLLEKERYNDYTCKYACKGCLYWRWCNG